VDALSTIFRAEGPRGLVRGIDAAILRTSMGSSVQLPSYNLAKSLIVNHGILPADSIWTFFLSSSVSGACVVHSYVIYLMTASYNWYLLADGHATYRYHFDADV